MAKEVNLSEFQGRWLDTSPQTIKGDLLSTKGDVYLVKDISGRLEYLHVDKNSKRDGSWFPAKKSKPM